MWLLLLLPLSQAAPLLPDYSCQYSPPGQELACSCSRSSLLLPPLASLLAEWPGRKVDSLAIEDCGSLDVTLDTNNLTHPLLQVRISNVDYLTVRGVSLPLHQPLDLHITGVVKQANLMGSLACPSCSSSPQLPPASCPSCSPSPLPSLTIQVTDSPLLILQSLLLKNLRLRIKTRNVSHVKVTHSDLTNLEEDSMEVFYSTRLELKNSVFGQLNSTRPIVVLNHVDKFQLNKVVGLSPTSYSILSNETQLSVFCRSQRASITGTVVAAIILTAAILTVIGLHRRGKLDGLL